MKSRRWTARWLLGLGTLAALLLLAEGALWATGRVRDPREFTLRRMTGALQQDETGRYVVDDARAFTTARGFRLSSAHAGRDATGDWPFRGRAGRPLPVAGSLPRVLVVGDSCVYGASLDGCDTLGWRLAEALDARELAPFQVAVIPLGVPGYSTEQCLLLLREALATLQPVAVVLYVAAWNDQAPALRAPDRELLAALADPSPLEWLRTHTRLGAALLHVRDRRPQAEIMAGWRSGNPPLGWRVPEADVEANVRALIAACEQAGAQPVLIAPPHPPETLSKHPRTAADAAAVMRAAAAAGAPVVDGQALLLAAGGDLARFFCDYVHPTPPAVALLAQAVAEPVAAIVSRARAELLLGCAADPVRVVAVEPREAFALGDTRVRLTLEGWTRASPLPEVLIGGAPLLDLRATGEAEIEGTLPANGAGVHDLVIQDEGSCSVLRDALVLRDPEITLEPGHPARLVVRARPGDRVRLHVATALLESPAWSVKGAARLADPRALPDLQLDAQGRAELLVPALPAGRVFLQALWSPPVEDLGSSLATRWTGVVELDG